MIQPITGLPGVGATRTSTPREILAGNAQFAQFIPGLRQIDGVNARDPGNTDLDVLRAGFLLGKITATGKYGASILGATTQAQVSADTTITVPAAVAVEIVRRIGATGNLKITAPPAAAGTVATLTKAYSAVNTSTGVITLAALGANIISGALVQPTDGSETIVTLVGTRHGVKVTDQSGTSASVLAEALLLDGYLKTANIVNYPTDTSLIAFVKAALRVNCPGMTFDDSF